MHKATAAHPSDVLVFIRAMSRYLTTDEQVACVEWVHWVHSLPSKDQRRRPK